MEKLLTGWKILKMYTSTSKVRHKPKDILVTALFVILANADFWAELELLRKEYPDYLRKYIELKNGIPSHDTLNRVMEMLSVKVLQQLYGKWQKLLNRNEGGALKKVICIHGRKMCSNKKRRETSAYWFRMEPGGSAHYARCNRVDKYQFYSLPIQSTVV